MQTHDHMDTTPTTPAETEEKKDWGHIKSYVHRSTHITPGQRRALNGELYERWCLRYQPGFIQYEEIFGRQAATVLEIGFGMGAINARLPAVIKLLRQIGKDLF